MKLPLTSSLQRTGRSIFGNTSSHREEKEVDSPKQMTRIFICKTLLLGRDLQRLALKWAQEGHMIVPIIWESQIVQPPGPAITTLPSSQLSVQAMTKQLPYTLLPRFSRYHGNPRAFLDKTVWTSCWHSEYSWGTHPPSLPVATYITYLFLEQAGKYFLFQ